MQRHNTTATAEAPAPPPQKRGINWLMVTPMVFMALPLVRHALKGNPYRDRIFLGLIGLGLVHGTYLIVSAGEGEEKEEFVSPATLAARARSAAPRPPLPASGVSGNGSGSDAGGEASAGGAPAAMR